MVSLNQEEIQQHFNNVENLAPGQVIQTLSNHLMYSNLSNPYVSFLHFFIESMKMLEEMKTRINNNNFEELKQTMITQIRERNNKLGNPYDFTTLTNILNKI